MPKQIVILEYEGPEDCPLPETARIAYADKWEEKAPPQGYVPIKVSRGTKPEGPLLFNEIELSEEMARQIVDEGMVVAVHLNYPRADRYGTPLFLHPVVPFGKGLAGYHGFMVTDGDVPVSGTDLGNDGPEMYDFTVAVSPFLAERLADFLKLASKLPVEKPLTKA